MLTLTPAYGRDYKSAREVREAWNAGKDFLVADFGHPYEGKPINKAQARETVNIRFSRLRKVVVIQPEKE